MAGDPLPAGFLIGGPNPWPAGWSWGQPAGFNPYATPFPSASWVEPSPIGIPLAFPEPTSGPISAETLEAMTEILVTMPDDMARVFLDALYSLSRTRIK